jgi:hypothetical protein
MCGQWAGLETEARSSGTRLLADKNPTPPWQWRREEKGSSLSWIEILLRKAARLLF